MTLDIIAWSLGTLFSLSIFALKTGVGLGTGHFKKMTISLVLTLYFIIFILMSIMGDKIVNHLIPVLQRGTLIHVIMAMGLILWGIYLLFIHIKPDTNSLWKHSLLMVIPCPVCLSAMAFSTFAALSILKISPILTGIALGSVFVVLCVIFIFVCRMISPKEFDVGLGLAMMFIGLYFIGSLIIPAKIMEAKAILEVMQSKSMDIDSKSLGGVIFILFVSFLGGLLLRTNTLKN